MVCAFVTPKERHRALVQHILGPDLRLIHIDCPLKVCIARDVKRLYAKAAAGQVQDMTGVQGAFEPPAAGLALQNQGLSVPESVARLLRLAACV